MEAVGLSFSFGIGDGGKKSIADLAYENMLDRNYILASEQFKTYKKREIIYNEEKLDTMLRFCNSQIPYILFERALEKYDEQNFKVSVALLKEIDFSGDANLKDKIESRLYIIADQLINNFFKIRKNNSLEYQIQYLKEIRNISYKVSNEVDKNLSQIYLDKGDILLNNGNYEEAYKYYIHASSVSEVNSERIKIKIDHLVISILNDVYNLLQNKENLIAYEKLFFAKDISSINSDNIDFFMTFVENRISDINADKIRERIINIIKNKQEFVASTTGKDIHLGDSYKDVINILGEPLDRISRSNFNNDYMMLIYSINDVEYKIFFKNKLLIDVERN